MPVDLEFDLAYLLTDTLGVEVDVVKADYNAGTGDLCVTARVGEAEKTSCIQVRACKGVPEAKRARCIIRILQEREEFLNELASKLRP